MDINEKLQQSLKEQTALIAKVEGSMNMVPAQQKDTQAVALKLLKDELALIIAAQVSLTNTQSDTTISRVTNSNPLSPIGEVLPR